MAHKKGVGSSKNGRESASKYNRPTEALNQINMLVAQHPNNAVAYAARGGIELERKM